MQTQTKKRRNFKRKHKILSHILSICLVLMLLVSFSVPVFASGTSGTLSTSVVSPTFGGANYTFGNIDFSPSLNLKLDADDNLVYKLDWTYEVHISSSQYIHCFNNVLGLNYDSFLPLGYLYQSTQGGIAYDNDLYYSTVNYLTGSQLKNMPIRFYVDYLTPYTGNIELDCSFVYFVNSITPASSSESADYESGYNAGYSDGLLDGEASVDTDAIYNEAYQAGYEAGFSDGSDDTLKEDKVLLETVSNEFTLPGQVLNNFSQQHIIGPTLSISNGYLSHSMYVPMGSIFEVGKDYLIDFKRFSVSNSDITYEVTLGEYVSHYVSNIGSFYLSGPGLSMSSRGEVIYSPTQTGDFNIRVSVPAELVLRSTYTEAVENDYVDIPSYGFATGKLNWDSTFSYEIDVYEIDIVEEIDYLRDLSNKMGDSNNLQQDTIDSIDNLTDTTNQQTESLNQATQQQTDTLTNGYDSTSGNEANDKLSGTLNEYQTAEDSLFATVSTGLDDYQFFDFESVPAVLTGISFISSLMTTWYNEAGGLSGIGIVLSVLFSTILISMVLGLSKFYQSAGHRKSSPYYKGKNKSNKKKGD